MREDGERLAVGRVVSLSFGVVRRNALAVATVVAGIAVLEVAGNLGARAALAAVMPGGLGARGESAVDTVVQFVVGCIAAAALTHVAVRDADGERTGPGRAWGTGLRLAVSVLGVSVVVGLGVGFAALLLLVPGVMLALRWAVAVPVRVAEGASINDSTRRSAELTAGNRWRLLGLFVATYLFAILIAFALGVGIGLLELVIPGSEAAVEPLLGTLVGTVMTGLAVLVSAVCYGELRRLRDGVTPGVLAAVFT